MDLRSQGVVKYIGLSTHAPELANKVLDMNILDMMMFSINPMYDFGQGDFAIGGTNERLNLYRRCEKEGVGISVMKPFNAGQLLTALPADTATRDVLLRYSSRSVWRRSGNILENRRLI